MISRLLVANRGEIARRVFRTCRELGIETVAVFSDPDAEMPHAREADLAVRLPGAAPSETYLRADLLVQAARDAGADAVHPGYGFLSEDAAFARAVCDAGLVWVGPSSDAVEVMGSKLRAREIAVDAGVPVLGALDPEAIAEGDLPVLVKASAGGGGRGMRVVRALDDLPSALDAARAEAESAFGDGTVFVEPYVERARHVEVQVLADSHGAVWALGERECSIQRRHQKVVEESPSPAVDDALRARLCDAAARLAGAVGYTNAGTVEFLLGPDGRFFFLEMNTRLQVEHPVTEAVYGVDLVAWQLRIAEGAALPDEPPTPNGHAIEARLYAEDPSSGWTPQSGLLHNFGLRVALNAGAERATRSPKLREEGTSVRVDAGVESGSDVSVHYDPMLAKVIAHAPTRDEAARLLAATLERARLHGPTTNRDLLVRILRHDAFRAGDTHTAFLDECDGLTAPLADEHAQRLAALAAALADAAAARAEARVQRGLPSGWRNVASQPQRRTYEGPSGAIEVAYRLTREGLVADGYEDVRLVEHGQHLVVLDVAGVRHRLDVARYGSDNSDALVCVDSPLGPVTLRRVERLADPAATSPTGSLLAPMPATVVRVDVTEGEQVETGQVLLVLEAMKMQQPVTAPETGVVTDLRVAVGAQVESGAVLAVVEPKE